MQVDDYQTLDHQFLNKVSNRLCLGNKNWISLFALSDKINDIYYNESGLSMDGMNFTLFKFPPQYKTRNK